jgi:hypothetical protein
MSRIPSSASAAAAAHDPDPVAALRGWTASMAALEQMQRLQWQSWSAMFEVCAAWQREFQDRWIAHWGGGVPIDA